MARLRSALGSLLTRASPRVAASVTLWRRARASAGGSWNGLLGVDYREREQLERIRRWDRYAELFARLRRDPSVNRGALGGPVSNGWFETPDAEAYAAMIGDLAPSEIVEIGAGFSTRVARRAVEFLALACRITVVDPEPRADVAGVADTVLRARVETLNPASLPLGARTLLFVDSSHVAVPGGDVPYVYAEVVPRLPAGASVHVHDVFLPFDYPARPRRALYNEQYVVHALLSASPRYRVLLATYLLSSLHHEELARVIPGAARGAGGSFWFGVRD